MGMLYDVLACAVAAGAKNRICTAWKRRMGNFDADLSLLGMFIGRALAAVLISVGAVLMMSGGANAKARPKGRAPVFDAQRSMRRSCRRRRAKGALPFPARPRSSRARYCSIALASRPERLMASL